MGGGRLLYPATAMGCGFVMFWIGFIVAHDFGLHVINALILGAIGLWGGVSVMLELERRDRGAAGD